MKNNKVLLIVSFTVFAVVIGACFIYILRTIFTPKTPFPLPKTHTYNGVVYEGTYEKYNKVVEQAANSRNPDICDEINFGQDQDDYSTSPEESRYFCRADYAVAASDVSYCKTLDSKVKFTGTIAQRDKCLRDLAKKLNDTSLCNFLSDKIYCPK